ncbi:hypothetical protein ACFSJQ_21355 [Vibrio olivae]|uniref:Uncharacterized protein n=1 Tax=Vibrio olivae TaxID=1243002 RepID=A0ABV5HU31_9VIBR
MENRCGQCRQFTRTANNQKDLCGAWEQPTLATRAACCFFMAKTPRRTVSSNARSSRSES